MKKFKLKYNYDLIYLGKENWNRSFWYHCILIDRRTKEVELVIDYKLDEEKRFFNLSTRPIKDFICWNIGNDNIWIKDILTQCDIIIGNYVESIGDFENESN